MSKESQAAVVVQPGAVEIRSYSLPDALPPGTFLLRVELAGVCGTDSHIYQGHLPTVRYPVLLGHEITGTIAALGEGVEHDYLGRPVSVGDRVAVKPGGISCGKCYQCAVDHAPGRCRSRPSVYGFKSPVTVEPHLTGGFAQYLFAHMPDTVFFKTELPPEVSVLMEPLTIALHATDRARVGLGSTVVVQGTGAIGLMAVACAKLSGAFPIIAIGAPAGRLETARLLGAHHTIDIAVVTDPEERRSLVLELLGSDQGATAVIGCAGQPSAFLEGLALVASGGVISEAGHFSDAGSIPFNPYSDLLWRNISVEGVLGAGPDSVGRFCRSIALLEQHDLPYELIVSHRIGLSRLEEAFRALSTTYHLDARDVVKLAVDPWQ